MSEMPQQWYEYSMHNVSGQTQSRIYCCSYQAPPEFVSSLGPVPVHNALEDPDIPRTDVFVGIDAAFQCGQHRYVLHGPMGVGKTTAAYQYAQSWLQSGRPWMSGESASYHVRWFSASDRVRLLSEYRVFAENCLDRTHSLRGRPMDQIRPKVDNFLKKTPNVLLVFDGVEDQSIVEEVVSSLLSTRTDVFVLITTLHATMYPTLGPSCRVMLDAFTDEQVHQYLSESWPSWSVNQISDLHCSPVFRRLINRHPKRLRWWSALVRKSSSASVQKLLLDLQDALVPHGQVNPVLTGVVDALIADCQRTDVLGWTLLRYAARLASAPIPLELLRTAMGVSDADMNAAVESLEKFSPCTLTNVSDSCNAKTAACLSLHSLARGEVETYDACNDHTPSTTDMDRSLLSAMLSHSTTIDGRLSQWAPRMLFPHIQFVLPTYIAQHPDDQVAITLLPVLQSPPPRHDTA